MCGQCALWPRGTKQACWLCLSHPNNHVVFTLTEKYDYTSCGGWMAKLYSLHMCVSRMLAQEGEPSILVIYSLTNVCKHDVIWKPEWNFTMSSSFGLKLIKATDYILLREWWMTLLTHVANIKRWHNQSLWNIFK